MAAITLPFAASATRRAPTTDELANGYGCGDADLELFDWMGWWTTAEIAAVITAAGLSADTIDSTRLLQALRLLFPRRAEGDVTIHVRTDGNDANDGASNTAGSAFATIAAALNYGLTRFNLGSYKLIIKLGNAGTYAAPGLIRGAPSIQIIGDVANQGNYNISGAGPGGGGSALLVSAARDLDVRGVTITNTSNINNTAGAVTGGTISFTNVTFSKSGGATTLSIFTGITGNITVNSGCIITTGTYGTAINLANNANFGIVGVVTLTGTPSFNTCFILMNACATFQAYGGSFSGAATGTRYAISTNSVASVGAGASYFPGSGAGATATGGQYV